MSVPKQKIKWVKTIVRPSSPLKMYLLIRAWEVGYKRLFGRGLENQLYFPEGSQHAYYYDEEEFRAFQEAVEKRIKKDKNFLTQHAGNCYRACEELIQTSQDINRSDLGKKPNLQLKKLFVDFCNRTGSYAIYLWSFLAIENYLSEAFQAFQREKKLSQKDFEIISTKIKLIPAEEEEVDLLKIAVKLKSEKSIVGKEISKLIQTHTKKYSWLPTYDFNLPVLTEEYFLKRLKQISNPKEQLEEKRRNIEVNTKKLKIIKKRIKSKTLLKSIDVLQEYLFLRTYRTDVLRQATYYTLPLLQEIAKRASVPEEDTYLLTTNEIIEFLTKNKLPKPFEIRQRKERYVIIWRNGKGKIISDPEEIKKIGKLLETKEETTVLKGTTAHPGLVRGRVAIIGGSKEIGKLKKGEILVTSMTTPDMTIAIHKTAAIVTDEGGITCHAAICSREFKIPCVIATKNATKVLEDGDLVEVDANKGIVKTLEKAK